MVDDPELTAAVQRAAKRRAGQDVPSDYDWTNCTSISLDDATIRDAFLDGVMLLDHEGEAPIFLKADHMRNVVAANQDAYLTLLKVKCMPLPLQDLAREAVRHLEGKLAAANETINKWSGKVEEIEKLAVQTLTPHHEILDAGGFCRIVGQEAPDTSAVSAILGQKHEPDHGYQNLYRLHLKANRKAWMTLRYALEVGSEEAGEEASLETLAERAAKTIRDQQSELNQLRAAGNARGANQNPRPTLVAVKVETWRMRCRHLQTDLEALSQELVRFGNELTLTGHDLQQYQACLSSLGSIEQNVKNFGNSLDRYLAASPYAIPFHDDQVEFDSGTRRSEDPTPTPNPYRRVTNESLRQILLGLEVMIVESQQGMTRAELPSAYQLDQVTINHELYRQVNQLASSLAIVIENTVAQ